MLSNTIWAVASLHLKPPQEWMDAFLEATQPRLGQFNSQGLSNVVWALARINPRQHLPHAWLTAFCACSRANMSKVGGGVIWSCGVDFGVDGSCQADWTAICVCLFVWTPELEEAL